MTGQEKYTIYCFSKHQHYPCASCVTAPAWVADPRAPSLYDKQMPTLKVDLTLIYISHKIQEQHVVERSEI